MLSTEKKLAFFVDLADILEIDPAQVTVDLSFADINWDSLAVVSSIALIDEHFDVIISGQALDKCNNISELLELVNAKLGN